MSMYIYIYIYTIYIIYIYINNLREFASANERHLDSSALGRWIPRPEPRRKTLRHRKPQGLFLASPHKDFLKKII